MVGEGHADIPSDAGVSHVLDATGQLEARDALQVQGADLVAKDDGILGLTSMALTDVHLARVSGRSG